MEKCPKSHVPFENDPSAAPRSVHGTPKRRFSILQRKVLTPNDFSSLDALAERILAFERHYETVARPFQWKFTRHDLRKLIERLERRDPVNLLAA